MWLVPVAEEGRFLAGEVNPPGRLALLKKFVTVDGAKPGGGAGIAHGAGRNPVALGLGESSTH